MDSQLVISLKKLSRFYGSKITIRSPAKINLYLNILGKYPDGFHRLESVIQRLSLSDTITIELIKRPGIYLTCDNPNLETEDNLCLRAAKLILDGHGLDCGCQIKLTKKIPVGAGLGGGSSNAASTLLALNCLCSLNLKKSELYSLGEKLGSDVNFFLAQSSFGKACGRGEKIFPLISKREFIHCIVFPGICLSTKKVYQRTRVKLTNIFNNVKIMQYALKWGDVSLLNKSVFNVLEKSAQGLCPELMTVKRYLSKSGIPFVMTGSGSAFYSLPLSRTKRNNMVLHSLCDKLPAKWSMFYAQTF
jgi:4-diphosphocytidyl-2-C-methyl-D-erythritol kinase